MMEEDYKTDQDASMVDGGNNGMDAGGSLDAKDYGDMGGFDESYEDEEGFRNNRGRGNFRNNRGRPPNSWMNGPPMGPRFRGRGYGPQGPPMRGRGFFRARGGPRYSNAPNFDNNWGPMGPPPPGMMGGPPPFGPPPGMMPGGPMGPPPNMMGQPPPFSGPPGMPPPNMPHGDLWVETKSEDGKSYFYHARTRETTWTRPADSPTCKIVTQAEMEAMVAANQPPQSMGMGAMANMGAMGMGGPLPGMMPGQVPPFMNQPPPWMKDASQSQQAEEPTPADDEMPPGESAPIQPPSMNQPPNMNQPLSMNQPPNMSQPPNMNQPPGMNQPPNMNQPPGMNQPPSMNQPPNMNQPPPNSNPAMGYPGMPGAPNFNQAPPNYNPNQTAPGTGGPVGPPGGYQGGPPGGYQGGPPGGYPGGPPGGFPGGWGGWGGWPPPLVAQPPPNLAAAAVPDSGGVAVPGGSLAPSAYPPASSQAGPQAVYSIALPQSPAGGQGWSNWPRLVAQPPPRAKAAVPDKGAATQQSSQMLKPPGLAKVNAPGQMPLLPAKIGMPGANLPSEAKISETPPLTEEKPEATVIPPELLAAASAWSTHKSPDGRPYYFHAANQESVWDKPKPLKELHELQAKIKRETIDPNKVIEVMDDEEDEAKAEAEAAAIAAAEAERKSAAEKEQAEKERLEREKAENERLEKEKAEKEKADKEKAKADKSRPVSSTPISGTPWCVVWTGDGRVFFYNPTAHTSVWERPAQLIGRSDVDKAVSQPVHEQKKDGAPTTPVKSSNGDMKRANTDSDDSDSEPIKKSKQDDSKKSNQIDLGKEAAIEAEVAAARQRGVVPHEQRLRSFLQMLHEKQVSAFSTWEKELHKIVFDSRYLMLNSKERRQVFDQYVRDRAEEERKEKKNRLQQKKLVFRALLEEAKLHSKSSFNDFSSKHGRDERFKSIEKPRDRELYFNEYLADLRKKEKEDKEKKREQVKAEYLALLKEKGIDRHARFQDVKKKIDADPRYKAVEGGAAREDYFREYCKQLKDDRRKDKDTKDRDRSVKKEKKEKERDKDKDSKEGKEGKEGKKKKEKTEAKKEEVPAKEEPEAEDVEMETEDTAAKEKRARAQASIKEREREVQRALATSLRDRDKERELHKRDEAVQHFNALLADLVRNPELAWREAKKQLKKDHRYNLAELLSKEDKERLFTQHTSSLASKRRDKLRAILAELGVGCTSHWKEVKEMLKNEPTTPVYSSSSTLEREFRDYQRDRQTTAKSQLRQLLLETRSVTHRSLAAVREHTAAMDAVHAALNQDARYTALDHIPDERQTIIMSYLEELDKKGPPPPPTATEPSRRPKP